MVKIINSRNNANSKRAKLAIAAHKAAIPGGDVAAYIKSITPPKLPFPTNVPVRSTDDDRQFYEQNKARFDAGNLQFKINNPNYWDQNGRRVFAAGSLQDIAQKKRFATNNFLNAQPAVNANINDVDIAETSQFNNQPQQLPSRPQPSFALRPWQKMGAVKKGGLFGNKTIGYRTFSDLNGQNNFISNIDRFNGLINGQITSPVGSLVEKRAQEIQEFLAKSRR